MCKHMESLTAQPRPQSLRGLGTRLNLALAMYYQTNKTSNLSSFSGPWPLQVAVQPNGPELAPYIDQPMISHSIYAAQTADCGIT